MLKMKRVLVNTLVIKTEKLILRKFTEKDTDAIFNICIDDKVNEFLLCFPLKTKEEAFVFIKSGLNVTIKKDGTLL